MRPPACTHMYWSVPKPLIVRGIPSPDAGVGGFRRCLRLKSRQHGTKSPCGDWGRASETRMARMVGELREWEGEAVRRQWRRWEGSGDLTAVWLSFGVESLSKQRNVAVRRGERSPRRTQYRVARGPVLNVWPDCGSVCGLSANGDFEVRIGSRCDELRPPDVQVVECGRNEAGLHMATQ